MVLFLGLCAVGATFLGGLFALHFKDKLHLVLGFSAGAVIGVAFFDLLPEAIGLSHEAFGVNLVTSLMAFGFIFYLIMGRLVLFHHHHDEACNNHNHSGKLGAGSLSIHSFLDGMAIGLAFQSSAVIGGMVAVAVLAHNFSDGINTVGMILKAGGTKAAAFKWLAVDAAAPFLGVVATLFFSVPPAYLGLVLAVFGGFFMYIGASDLLPESHHAHPKRLTTIMTLLGIGLMYIIIKLVE